MRTVPPKGKRIKGVKPEQPVAKVARRALAQRFDAVQYYLPLAAERPEEDAEHVHQLRVTTRRALAAMDIFADLLPPRRARAIRKDLKCLLRAAGDARDLDVLAERLRRESASALQIDCRQTIHAVQHRRFEVQKPIVKARAKLKRKRFNHHLRALVKKTRWRSGLPEANYGDAAQRALCPIVSAFFAAASADLADLAALHRMRIRGKALRYAMELLIAAFDCSWRKELYSAFEQLQTKLGEINDLDTARALFRRWMDESPDQAHNEQLGRWHAAIEKDLMGSCRAFRQWWTCARAGDLRQQFDCILVGAPRERRGKQANSC